MHPIRDCILFLFFASRKYKIYGKRRFFIELYFLQHDILKQEFDSTVIFTEKTAIPYSEIAERVLNELVAHGLVDRSGHRRHDDISYIITPRGCIEIAGRYFVLSDDVKAAMTNGRTSWDTHLIEGLLNILYTHYPIFREIAVQRRKFKVIDWDSP